MIKRALFLPPFGELSDPRVLVSLAVEAEQAGWDGFFLWDHLARPEHQPQEIADPWIALAAIATVTTRIRIGPMVTPTARRRPQKLAKEATTLDWLSGGRVILGLGLGVDTSGELSKFGELTDPVARGDALDEAAILLDGLFSGETVHHHGTYFQADDIRYLPRPVQQPRIPMWFAARGTARRPVRRAARYDGLFAIEIDLEELDQMVRIVDEVRGSRENFDVAVSWTPETDLAAWEAAGATWAMWSTPPGEPLRLMRQRINSGPD